jgi:hypothetical protein
MAQKAFFMGGRWDRVVLVNMVIYIFLNDVSVHVSQALRFLKQSGFYV